MKRASYLIALALSGAASAQPVSQAPWMTGEQLLRLISYASIQGARSPEQDMDSERARLYIDGVHDATEGKTWCYSTRYQPGREALQSDVAAGLRQLRPDQLQRDAANLIIEIWRKKWPCQGAR
jgi:hypothetical protein